MILEKIWSKKEIDLSLATFDWNEIDALTDDQLEARAKADPDAWNPTAEEYNRVLVKYETNKAKMMAAE